MFNIPLCQMNLMAGQQNRYGVCHETRRTTLVYLCRTRQAPSCPYPHPQLGVALSNGHHGCPNPTTVRDIPTEVLLTPEADGVPQLSVVNVDNLQTVQKNQLGALITTLSLQRMAVVEQAICFALGMDGLLR